MDPLSHKDLGAIGAPAWLPSAAERRLTEQAMRFSNRLPLAAADAALAIAAFAANQTVTGQVSFAHLVGEANRAQARELATNGAQAMPEGVLRDTVMTLADAQATFADNVIDAANRWGRTFAHLAFAFPVPDRRS